MIEYLEWARGQLAENHKPSLYDWQNMKLAEMADRALAICESDSQMPTISSIFKLKENFEAMARTIKEKYPYPKPRGW